MALSKSLGVILDTPHSTSNSTAGPDYLTSSESSPHAHGHDPPSANLPSLSSGSVRCLLPGLRIHAPHLPQSILRIAARGTIASEQI